MRESAFAQPKHSVQVGLKDTIKLLRGDVFDSAHLHHLIGGVVDQNIDASKLLYRSINQQLALLLFNQVTSNGHGATPGVLDKPRCLLCIFLFRWQVRDHYISAFPGEGNSDGPTDAGVTPCDHRSAVVESVAAAIGILAVVRLVVHRAGLTGIIDLVTIGVG